MAQIYGTAYLCNRSAWFGTVIQNMVALFWWLGVDVQEVANGNWMKDCTQRVKRETLKEKPALFFYVEHKLVYTFNPTPTGDLNGVPHKCGFARGAH